MKQTNFLFLSVIRRKTKVANDHLRQGYTNNHVATRALLNMNAILTILMQRFLIRHDPGKPKAVLTVAQGRRQPESQD
ncbi:hypothetical protein [Acanthopleuribacter pedis]|uniref:Uncharacterized protein n=1 Tax=Acanthopleuribacter pedis TaxID=442870 RepID=A0A8J7QCH7_9BACT|nr:hypothetical protein [Acanthopleuribacter pedis]MBO1321594.1 hypothetical protein [Acanthopleuribacter pedis]